MGTEENVDLFKNQHDKALQSVYRKAYDVSIEDKRAYCDQHGYDYHLINNLAHERTVSWSRIPGILSVLGQYDWVFYLDLDTLIVDHEVSLEAFVDLVGMSSLGWTRTASMQALSSYVTAVGAIGC